MREKRDVGKHLAQLGGRRVGQGNTMGDLPVDAPIAPMSTEGTAITRQPKAARKDST